ncbi:MAG TPA: TetR/AcrR family transcriptional regulator [Burkholderiaceae bacterium]|nr:TetR/AcrR family transcriptional regulator [Burkholderiaceae bacterium]
MPFGLSAGAVSSNDSTRAQPRKGERTRSAVIGAALEFASRVGIEGLTIGALAERMGMSKSGVIAHFGSRESLQLAVVERYAEEFIDEVLRPALEAPRGLPRLQDILERWLTRLAREIELGCLMISGATEYDDRPGPLHDAMVRVIDGWKGELRRAIEQAKEAGHFAADADADQVVFEIYGLMLMLHQDSRLMHSPAAAGHARAGLSRLIDAARRPASLATDTPFAGAAPATERRHPAVR